MPKTQSETIWDPYLKLKTFDKEESKVYFFNISDHSKYSLRSSLYSFDI